MRRRPLSRVAVVAAGVLVTACVGDGPSSQAPGPAAPRPSTTSMLRPFEPASTAAAPASSPVARDPSVAGADSPLCPREGLTGAGDLELAGDVDGDGAQDRIVTDGESVVGVTTASGATSRLEIATAKPAAVLGVEDADQDGRAEIFVRRTTVSEGEVVAAVSLVVYRDCALSFVVDEGGEPYRFVVRGSPEEQAGAGQGVGCIDADGDGRRDLVGLSFERDGEEVAYRRTIVELDGAVARNGPVDSGVLSAPQDDQAIAALAGATCGENPLEPMSGPG